MSEILTNSVCYLAGPIDFDKDLGVSYRQYIKEECKRRGLKIKFLDPTRKITGLSKDVGEEQEQIRKMKASKDWHGLRRMMKRIVKEDLRQVDLSDFIILLVDVKTHMCGSYHEMLTAEWERKPVLTIVKGGKDTAPSWLYGILNHRYMYNSADECIDFLVRINEGKAHLNNKWVLFRQELDKLNH